MKKVLRAIFSGIGITTILALVFSVALWFTGYREEGLFVGLWVPSILSLGSLVLANARGASP